MLVASALAVSTRSRGEDVASVAGESTSPPETQADWSGSLISADPFGANAVTVAATNGPTDSLLAAGIDRSSRTTKAWSSEDGVVWMENAALALDAPSIHAVATNGTVSVAVGEIDGAPAVWQIAGGQFDEVPLTADVIYDVAATSDGFAIVGRANQLPTVWLSDDGSQWAATSLSNNEGDATSVDADGASVVAVGRTGAGAKAWTLINNRWAERTLAGPSASLHGVAVAGTSVAVIGLDGNTATIWRSSDNGSTWDSSNLPTAEGEDPAPTSVTFANDSSVLVLVANSKVIRFDGTTWTQLTPEIDQAVRSEAILDLVTRDDNVLGVGSQVWQFGPTEN